MDYRRTQWMTVVAGRGALVLALTFAACTSGVNDDGDGIDADHDLCPESPHGARVDDNGCAPSDDSDGDGIPEDQDLCPDTEFGPNSDGCDVHQVDEDGNPLVDAAAFRVFLFDGGADSAIAMRTLGANVVENGMAFEIRGTVLVDTPLGHVPLFEAELSLHTTDGNPLHIDRVTGRAAVPLPDLGVLAGLEVEDLVSAEIGLDYGVNLEHLEAPLQKDRRYLYFDFSAGLSASLGPISMSAGGASATVVLDPADPMFYVSGGLLGLAAIGPIEDVGIGMSAQGLLAFEPVRPLERANIDAAFDGHLYLGGTVPVGRLPLSIDGEVVVNVDPDEDGATIFNDASADFVLGGNGVLSFGVEFLEFFEFGFELGKATAVAKVTDSESYAFFSGELAPDVAWLPSWIPMMPRVTGSVEALVSDSLADSYVHVDARYAMDLSGLAETTGIQLDELYSVEGRIDINREVGVRLEGISQRSFSPLIEASSAVRVVAHYKSETDWFIEMTGDLSIGGVNLSANATARLSAAGILVQGVMDTGVSTIALSGEINRDGVRLEGHAAVNIDIVAGKQVVEWVVDGALCGYAVVENGALCGYETVTSAAICGTQTITNGAVCGYKFITSGAVCGYKTIGCWLNPFKWGSCKVAKECRVAKSCSVPRTCTNFSAPKTCTDWSQPLSCERTSVIPDWNWGAYTGSVDVVLSNAGLRGSVSGDYCYEGSCEQLVGGSLNIGDPIEACVQIPTLGEFCQAL